MTRTLRAVAVALLLLAVIGPSLVFLPPFRAPIDASDTPVPTTDPWYARPERPVGEGEIYMPIVGGAPGSGSGPIVGQPNPPTTTVSDLAAVSAFGVVGLTWSAPMGDGPLGGATAYEIRYATSPLSDANWDQAQRVDDAPYPAAPRGREAFSIAGLQEGQTYHVALRTVSASGGLGPVSNDATVTVGGSAGNLASNGSFEGSLSGWNASGDAGASSAEAHDGGSSARLANGNVEQTFGTSGGTSYKVTAWVKIVQDSVGSWGGFRAEVLSSGGASLAHSGYLHASAYGNDWFKIALTFRASDSTSRLAIGYFGDGSMVVHVDDVRAFAKGANIAPVLSYHLDPSALGALPGEQSFGVEASDPDGAVSQVYWDFGDGMRALQAGGTRRVSNAGSFVATVRVVDDEGLAVTQSVEWRTEDGAWPQLSVAAPAALSALSDASSYALSGTAASCQRVRVSSDRGYAGAASGTGNWSATVPLQPGVNRILIQAHGDGGRITSSERIVRYVPAGDLTITDLRESAGSVARWDVLEASFNVANSAATHVQFPYDPAPPAGLEWIDGISVEGVFTRDNWQTMYRRPAFLNQRYERQNKDGQEWLYPTGAPEWTVRFSPPEEGNWTYRIEVSEAKGSVRSADRTFSVGAPSGAANHGPIGVSPNDTRYFEHADGTTFLGTGHGVSFSADSYSYDAAELFARMGAGNQELLRWWIGGHLWSSAWQPWNSTTLGHDGYIPATGLTPNRGYANGLAAMRLDLENPIMFQGWESGHASLVPGRTYRLRIRWRTEEVTGPASGGQPFGATVKLVGWPEPGNTGSTPALVSHVNGDTPWHVAEGEFVAEGNTLPNLALILENTTGGSAYIDEVSLYEVASGGALGPQLLRGSEMNSHLAFDPRRAAGMDAILAEAQAAGKYLKLVVSEKNEYLLNRLAPGGVPDAKGGHFADGEGTPSRRLNEYYWRYLFARFGAYRSVHSWELVNEHDPNNMAFFSLAADLATLAKADGNPHLASTSTWASLAEGSWKNSASEAISYVDYHAYVHGTGWIEPKEELSNDSARLFAEYDRDVASQGLGKPVIWGEQGIDGTEGTDYPDPLLANDQQGVWLHKLTWARTGPGGVYPIYWYTDLIYGKSLHGVFGAWNRFMAGIPLSNGHYRDAGASASSGDIRALGQKDTDGGRAHLWIDNSRHTWRAVVDGASIPGVSGSVTLSMERPNQNYTVTWYDTNTGEATGSQSVTADGSGNVTLGVSDLRTDTAVKLQTS